MNNEYFIILEPFGNTASALCSAVIKQNLNLIIVTQKNVEHLLDKNIVSKAKKIIYVDFNNEISEICAEIYRSTSDLCITGITTGWEFFTPLVAYIAEYLNLPGNNPDLSISARDKWAMANCFSTKKVRHAKTALVTSVSDIIQNIEESKFIYPFIIKPIDNAGSCGVSLVNSYEEIQEAFDIANSFKEEFPHGFSLKHGVIMQSYIGGKEYSVESLIFNKDIKHIQITEKFTSSGKYRSEIGHKAPADLDLSTKQIIFSEVSKALNAIGFRAGGSHTEVKVWNNEVWVIEAALRPGGDDIIKLIPLSTGVDFAEAIISSCTGIDMDITPKHISYSAVKFIVPEKKGIITSTPSQKDIAGLVEFENFVNIGDFISPSKDNISRLGKFIVTAGTSLEIDKLIENISSELRYSIEK